MGRCFRWTEHPEVGDFVAANYSRHSSPDLARMIADQFGVHLQPGAIRDYYRHRKAREALAGQGGEPPVAEAPEAESRRPDQRKPMDERDVSELDRSAMEEVERKEATRLGQTSLSRSEKP